MDELLRTPGYAIVSREDGVTAWQLGDHGQGRFEGSTHRSIEKLAEQQTRCVFRTPQRKALLSALAVVAVMAAGLRWRCPGDSAHRLRSTVSSAVADNVCGAPRMRPLARSPRAMPGTETGGAGRTMTTGSEALPASPPLGREGGDLPCPLLRAALPEPRER